MKRNILRQSRRDLEQIKYLLAKKADEKISMNDFCRMHGISSATYYNWQKRTIVKSEKITTRFLSGVIKSESANDMPFIEIEKPGGVIIRIFKQMPTEFIKSLC